MKKLLKIIIFAILVGFGVIWYSESQKRRTMIPLEFRGERDAKKYQNCAGKHLVSNSAGVYFCT